ncbi:unnamed protein product [Paramecium octaurelia]|uniref:Uncharacterized protein n=1 Tax=Paramecium octaurelia TaxID=43137 RepID=A0A8S1SHP0_PAROT|nr:unnamed protein product [Paramecium octaurelia]
MEKKVVFIRHAESEYNLAQRIAKNSVTEVKLEEEDQDVKYSSKYCDAPLTKFGREQCDPTKFEDLRIETVVVSPLKRAVETAVLLFQNHPNKPKFVVEPYIREMFLSGCDFGIRLQETINEYPFINYDRLLANPIIKQHPNMWSLEFIYNQNSANILKQYIKDTEYGSQACVEKVLEYMKQHPIQVETFEENTKRVEECKKHLQFDEPFVCVSHSRTIHTLTGKFIHNCTGIEVNI